MVYIYFFIKILQKETAFKIQGSLKLKPFLKTV